MSETVALSNPKQTQDQYDLSVYSGLDKAEAVLDPTAQQQLRESLQGSENPNEEKASAVNIAWAARQMKMDPEAVAQQWDGLRDEVASTIMGRAQSGISDTQLYGLIGGHLQKQQGKRQMMGTVYQHMTNAAMAGEANWLSAFSDVQSELSKNEAYDPSEADTYRVAAKAYYNAAKAEAPQLGTLSEDVSTYYAGLTKNGFTDEMAAARDGILERLNKLNPQQQQAVLNYAGLRAAKTIDSEGTGTSGIESHVENLERSIAELGRSTVRTLGNIVNAGNASAFTALNPHVLSPTEQGAQDAMKKRFEQGLQAGTADALLDQTYRDVANKLPAEHWYEKLAYGAEAMLPQTVPAAINPIAGAALLTLSMSDNARQALVLKGVDPEKAQVLGLATGGVQAALMGLTGKVLAGRTPEISNAIARLAASETETIGQGLAKTLKLSFANAAIANADQLLIDATPDVIQGLASRLDSTIPGVDWKESFGRLKATRVDTFLTLLPLVMVGTGQMVLVEGPRTRALLNHPEVGPALGIPPEAMRQVAETPSIEAASDLLHHYVSKSAKESFSVFEEANQPKSAEASARVFIKKLSAEERASAVEAAKAEAAPTQSPTPTLGELIGKDVEHLGYRGTLVRDEEGNFMVLPKAREKGSAFWIEVADTGKDPAMSAADVGVALASERAMPTRTTVTEPERQAAIERLNEEHAEAAATVHDAAPKAEVQDILEAQQALIEKYPDIFSSIPPNHVPIEIQRADGTIVPAAMNGYYEAIIPGGPAYPSVGYKTETGWSHGILGFGSDKSKIITPYPSFEEWQNRTAPTAKAERQSDGSYIVTDKTGKTIDRAANAHEAAALIQEASAPDMAPVKSIVLPKPVTAEEYKMGPYALGATAQAPVVQATIDALATARKGIVAAAQGMKPEAILSAHLDAANNKAMRFARQSANEVANALKRTMERSERRPLDERALTFMVESGRDLAKLQEWQAKLETVKGTDLPFASIYEARKAIEHAISNFQRLSPVAEQFEAITDAQVAKEQANGFSVGKRANYVPHQQEIDTEVVRLFERGGGSGAASGHKHARSFETFVDSLLAGVKPKTLNAVTLLENRLNAGERGINRKLWAEAGKQVIDPTTNLAVFADPIVGTKEVQGKTVPDVTAPKGYQLLPFGGSQIAVHDGYVGLFKALNDTSAFNNSAVGRASLKAAAAIKHGVIAIDTFHLGRVAFHLASLKGPAGLPLAKPGYERGLLLLDYSTGEIHRMVQDGQIDGKMAEKLLPQIDQAKANLDLLMNEGLNVGAIGDVMHREWSEKVLSKVGYKDKNVASFSKWLFGEFQRGGMVEAALLEFDRVRQQSPGRTDLEVARQVARDVNTRFGNLQNQSWVKSKTFHDLMRLVFLAPGWNEGLIRSELGAYAQMGTSAWTAASQRRIVAGTLMRNVGGLLLGQFIANQVINYITRGKPTWENEEEGMSAKISAYIPDVIGDGPGFFLNPFSLPAEIGGQITKQVEKRGDLLEAVKDVTGYKLGPFGRAGQTLLTGRHQGKSVRGGEAILAAAMDLAPIPMQVPSVLSAIKSAAGGEVTEHVPGEIQKQVVASFGVKLENAPSDIQRVNHLAQEFKREHEIKSPPVYGESDYGPLLTALTAGNTEDEETALHELLRVKTPQQIAHYFALYPRRTFTGSRAHEAQFMESLSENQKEAYKKAVDAKGKISQRAFDLLASVPPGNSEDAHAVGTN